MRSNRQCDARDVVDAGVARRTDDLQQRPIPFDDRINFGRGCGFGALGGRQTEASSHAGECECGNECRGSWKSHQDNSARVIGSALKTVDFGRLSANRTNLVSCSVWYSYFLGSPS